jgi:hypothetical protein
MVSYRRARQEAETNDKLCRKLTNVPGKNSPLLWAKIVKGPFGVRIGDFILQRLAELGPSLTFRRSGAFGYSQ